MTDTLRLPFPWALHEMLNQSEERGFSNIVSWSSDGTCFKVHDTEAFVKHVVPLYFRQKRYKTFQHQLHLYGFSTISSGKNRSYRAHELFIRGHKNLSANMKPIRMRSQASESINGATAGSCLEATTFSSNRSSPTHPRYNDAEDDDACLRSFIDKFYDTPVDDRRNNDAEDDDACLRSFIDSFYDTPVDDIDQEHACSVDNNEVVDIFGDRGFFSTEPTEQEFSFDIDALQPTPMKDEIYNLLEPNMIICSSPLMKGGQPFGLVQPKLANNADPSRLDGMLLSFLSRAT